MPTDIEKTASTLSSTIGQGQDFDEAAIHARDSAARHQFAEASNSAFTHYHALEHALTFQTPQTLKDTLILSLIASKNLAELKDYLEGHQDQNVTENLACIERLIDAILIVLERESGVTRQRLGLEFMRPLEETPVKHAG